MMENDLKFEDTKQTIAEILKTRSLPVVVRVYDDGYQTDADFDFCRSKISGKTEVLLQKRLKLKYCHIKILNYYDNKAVEKEKGPEYVLEHDTYVGEEYLIPLKYHGKVNFVHRPGSWRRYATVSQVIHELPRYIRLRADTVAFPSNGIGKNQIISANTTLEVVRKFRQPNDNATYLECSDGNESYAFGEKDRINCTEIDDTRLYNLFELVRFKMLPKVILFKNVAPKDLILMDNEHNSAMLTGVEGPLELIGFVDIEVLVGWVRDKEAKTYQTVVIPCGAWNVILAQERSLHGKDEKRNYIKRKYPQCYETGFIEKSLYMMHMDQCKVTWLRGPEFYVRTLNGNHMFEAIPTDFPDSSDDESDKDYIEIPEELPPVPARRPVANNGIQEHENLEERMNEKKSLFHKVHKELFGWFSHTEKGSVKHSKPVHNAPEIPERPHRIRVTRSQSEKVHSEQPVHIAQTKTGSNDSTSQTVKDGYISPKSPTDSDIYQYGPQPEPETEVHDYDYPDIKNLTEMFSAATQNRPLPEPPTSPVTESADKPIDSLSRGTSNSQASEIPTLIPTKSPQYVSLSMKQAEHLFRENLTMDDFYNYTVMETAHCLKHCGLEEFAAKCHDNRLDGSFFKNFDLDELKKEPFNLSSFSVLKVRKMIFNGWRPNYKN